MSRKTFVIHCQYGVSSDISRKFLADLAKGHLQCSIFTGDLIHQLAGFPDVLVMTTSILWETLYHISTDYTFSVPAASFATYSWRSLMQSPGDTFIELAMVKSPRSWLENLGFLEELFRFLGFRFSFF